MRDMWFETEGVKNETWNVMLDAIKPHMNGETLTTSTVPLDDVIGPDKVPFPAAEVNHLAIKSAAQGLIPNRPAK
jgi:hypothetical protein